MAEPRVSPTIYLTVDGVQSSPGPLTQKFAIILNGARGLYRWVRGSIATDDAWTTLEPSGGMAGAWELQGFPDKGDNLGAGNATIQVGGKDWRVLPAATLAANATLTLGTTNARAGYRIRITREDVGAYTYAIANGGPAAGTLVTCPVSSRAYGIFYFDGTNWSREFAATMI